MSTLLIANAGGHLKQLHRLVPRLAGVEGPFLWVTYRTGQSESLLAHAPVVFGPPVDSRDWRGIAGNARLAVRLLARGRFSRVITTGSSIALGFLPPARAFGVPCHYIESAARGARPSQSGRLVRWLPGVRVYTQYPAAAVPPWRYIGSVFDEFELAGERRPERPLRRVVVTLGTTEMYGFPRLVERLMRILPPEADVLWQTGATDTRALGLARARDFVPADELEAAIQEADLVVAHAGAGSALSALEAGRTPVLVPRRRAHGENVDDHQSLIARELADRGLAVNVLPEALGLAHLTDAMTRRAIRRPDPPALCLVED